MRNSILDYGAFTDFPVHRIAAAKDVAGLENLGNLDELPPTGAILLALPMKIEDDSAIEGLYWPDTILLPDRRIPVLRNVSVTLIAATLVLSAAANAQRAGQSATIRTGTVTAMKAVDLNDGNAVGGALVGGAFGAALTRSSKSSSRRDRNAALGAVLGGAAAASKTTPGRVYTVTTNEGTIIQIATEQTEIRVDDCVFVEEVRGGANIRRAPATACAPETQSVLQDKDIVEDMQDEAAECVAAKQQLVDADSDAAVDRALRKVQLLCYD